MNSALKKCRVCGKDYEPCRSVKYAPSVFHWREVACSPECGETYLKMIMESRNPSQTKTKKRRFMPVEVTVDPVEATVVDEEK